MQLALCTRHSTQCEQCSLAAGGGRLGLNDWSFPQQGIAPDPNRKLAVHEISRLTSGVAC